MQHQLLGSRELESLWQEIIICLVSEMKIRFHACIFALFAWSSIITSSFHVGPMGHCGSRPAPRTSHLPCGHLLSFFEPNLRLRGSGTAKAEDTAKDFKRRPITSGLQQKIKNKDRSRVRRKKTGETKAEARSKRKEEKRKAKKKASRMAARQAPEGIRRDVKNHTGPKAHTTAERTAVEGSKVRYLGYCMLMPYHPKPCLWGRT
jgi:hypothetical protein